jgi:hypothetical protein
MRSLSVAKRAASVLAVSATLLAAGCANSSPGVVAYVGDEKISEKQVTAAVAAVQTTAQEGQTISRDAVINAMIQGELSAQIARDKRLSISDAERDAFLKTTNLAPLLNVAGAKPIAYDVADQQLVLKQLGEAPYLAEIQQRKVELNPRYGVLDPKQQAIITDQSGSLSEPEATQTP